jgi:hypothetical protein
VSFWLASIGILLSLFGTLLLVFCIPVVVRFDSSQSLSISVPDKNESDLHFAWNLFKGLFKRKDQTLMIALSSLLIGTTFQIWALWSN